MEQYSIVLCWDVPIISPSDTLLLPSERRILRLPIRGQPRPDGEKGKIGRDIKAIRDVPDGRKIKRNHKVGSNISKNINKYIFTQSCQTHQDGYIHMAYLVYCHHRNINSITSANSSYVKHVHGKQTAESN